MARYRKRQVVIDAFRLGHDEWPAWFNKAVELYATAAKNGYTKVAGSARVFYDERHPGLITSAAIYTISGVVVANHGEWIVRGVKGELYPCRADIFESTYEPAGDEA